MVNFVPKEYSEKSDLETLALEVEWLSYFVIIFSLLYTCAFVKIVLENFPVKDIVFLTTMYMMSIAYFTVMIRSANKEIAEEIRKFNN